MNEKRAVSAMVDFVEPYLKPHPGITLGELCKWMKHCEDLGLNHTPEDFTMYLNVTNEPQQ